MGFESSGVDIIVEIAFLYFCRSFQYIHVRKQKSDGELG